MFQFARLPQPALFDSGERTRALPRVGFPIRTSRDQRLVSTYSGLIAAAHVLHRLLAPRHPPCALSLLIVKNTLLPLWSFQGAREHAPAVPEQTPPKRRSLKTQQRDVVVEVDVILGEPGHRTAGWPSTRRAPPESRAPVSLERR